MTSTAREGTQFDDRWQDAILCGDELPPSDGTKSLSENVYVALGNARKTLVTLCYGLKNADGTPLIDLDALPWSQEPKAVTKPANKDLAMEVLRRQKIFKDLKSDDRETAKALAMKPKNKPRDTLIQWLLEWPIVDPDCIDFLTTEANRVQHILQAAIDESRETAVAIQHGAWSGSIPYLRLIHCILDCDATRSAYLRRNEVKKRDELDAANSPVQCKTGYAIIADCWNDPEFNPKTTVSSCHVDFASEIPLPYSKVARLLPADSLGVQNRLSNIRATMLRIIDKWEQSGQGDGGRVAEPDQERPAGWGKLDNRTQEALDNRANFLGDSPSWYLYFWEAADKYQLLGSTLQRLCETVGVTCGTKSPTVSRGSTPPPPNVVNVHKRKRNATSTTATTPTSATTLREGESYVGDSLTASPANYHALIQTTKAELTQEKELYLRKRLDDVNDALDNYKEKLNADGNNDNKYVRKMIKKKKKQKLKLKIQLHELLGDKFSVSDTDSDSDSDDDSSGSKPSKV
jgi:hypothetical protein